MADREPAKYADAMEAFLDPIKADSDPTAVLWELAVKEGYGLNSTIAEAKVGTNTIHTVTDGEKDPAQSFRVCLDDTLAANLALQCWLKTV